MVNVKFGDKIIDLKIKIFEKTSFPASDQCLVAFAKVLDDRFSIRDYEILEHSLTIKYIRLRGGVKQSGSKQ